jgi:ABC-type sugar transport system permease subunit
MNRNKKISNGLAAFLALATVIVLPVTAPVVVTLLIWHLFFRKGEE